MKKKIVIGLVMLIALTASLSAQAASVIYFDYLSNGSEDHFILISLMIETEYNDKLYLVNKLPNPMIQAIDNSLRNFSLDTGDIFYCEMRYQATRYMLYIRITDARNSKWQFSAWRERNT